MDAIDRYKIEESIEDVIIILDSAPIYRNLVPETNDVQLTNRAPIAHLAIERGLKALIVEAGGPVEHTHGLHKLYRDLKECDQESADYLATAFEDAVNFFGYNVNIKGFKQFRSLDNYLSKVGNKKAFGVLRYWAIGETGEGESPISYISLPIHRELLCALGCLFHPSRETVSKRVEDEVAHAMFKGRQIHYNIDDTIKKQAICWYRDWLVRDHTTRRGALKEAVRQNFVIKDNDDFVSQTLRDAYTDLQQSEDPAVRYFVCTLTYLPKRSQLPNSDAVPEIQWYNQDQTRGMVVTPAGTCLGSIEKYPDGAWGIGPQEEGLVRVSDIAEAMADAKHYLVNRLTRQVTVNVNGKLKQLRIVSQRDFFLPLPEWTPDAECSAETYEIEFWNGEHALQPGEAISIELQPKGSPGYASVLEGTVITVAEQKVSIAGTERGVPTKHDGADQ